MQGLISAIRRLRINTDGPGVRSVVFMQNCPLSCVWCCNPETRRPGRGHALSLRGLYKEIRSDLPYFLYSGGGITFSGGEPLLQSDFLSEFIRTYCRDFSVSIETSLYAQPEKIEMLIPLIDTWYVDFKVFDEQLHQQYTGVSNRTIKNNIDLLVQKIAREKVIITYPMIPGHNIALDQAERMLSFLKERGLCQIKLHPSRTTAGDKYTQSSRPVHKFAAMDAEQLNTIRDLIMRSGFTIIEPQTIFGRERCAYLKEIRQKICTENALPVSIAECDFEGECIGSCLLCEWELNEIGCYLEMDFEEEQHV